MIYFPETAEAKEFLLAWAMKVIGVRHLEQPYPVGFFIGDDENPRLAAVGIYHDYRPPSVFLSLASVNPHWATKKNIQCLYSYAFTPKPVGLGVNRITALCDKRNKRSRKFIAGVGFKEEGCIRQGGGAGEDLIVYGLLRRELEVAGKNISVEGDVAGLRKKLAHG